VKSAISPRPLLLGLALLLLALLLVLAATALRGSLNPACAGARAYSAGCFAFLPTALMVLALPVALAGGVLVAIWQGRRAAAADEDA
jgi:predicted branched-subunit amino acid permease